eukprot:jgi/Psemu1/22572/gm1.22572_g
MGSILRFLYNHSYLVFTAITIMKLGTCKNCIQSWIRRKIVYPLTEYIGHNSVSTRLYRRNGLFQLHHDDDKEPMGHLTVVFPEWTGGVITNIDNNWRELVVRFAKEDGWVSLEACPNNEKDEDCDSDSNYRAGAGVEGRRLYRQFISQQHPSSNCNDNNASTSTKHWNNGYYK